MSKICLLLKQHVDSFKALCQIEHIIIQSLIYLVELVDSLVYSELIPSKVTNILIYVLDVLRMLDFVDQ